MYDYVLISYAAARSNASFDIDADSVFHIIYSLRLR